MKHNIFKKWFYYNILKRKYFRYGKCNMCGACCKRIYVQHAKNVVDDEELFSKLKDKHDFYKSLKIIGKDENGLIFECMNLEGNKCKIHNKRWKICKKYPDEKMFMMGGCMMDNCGYRFESIYTFDEIMKKTGQ